MTIPPPLPSGDDALHALADDRLSPAEAARLREQLDALSLETSDAWHDQREMLRNHHAALLEQPLPATFADAARKLSDTHRRQLEWWRWGGLAASLALAFIGGWAASDWARPQAAAVAVMDRAQGFARQAAVAHVVYQPEVRHPVEVTAAQQDHLVQWLSKRLDRPLKVPNLSSEGYELVGGRLLPGDSGARAQFMFQNASGERITLYLGAVGAADARSGDTAFSFLEDGAAPGFYWVDRGFGYALSGKLPRATLLALATAVYRQL